jgi:diadenosine tetraphosphate (Ap4A) HIT family hydrolase
MELTIASLYGCTKSPWPAGITRIRQVENLLKQSTTCIFCNPGKKVLKNALAYARYDDYPVSPGHMLIMPFRHVADYFDTTIEEKHAMLELVVAARELLDAGQHPDGYNLGINCGAAAGQSVPHAHYHLIPRYQGDMENPRGGVRGVIPDRQKYQL